MSSFTGSGAVGHVNYTGLSLLGGIKSHPIMVMMCIIRDGQQGGNFIEENNIFRGFSN